MDANAVKTRYDTAACWSPFPDPPCLKDFERKSALFSLAVSHVLLINMWEHAVGLYNGANMGLLKTVFEVHLQLFQQKKLVAGHSSPTHCKV